MYKVFSGRMIQMSRGDYALISVRVTGAEEGEEVVFSITKQLNPDQPLIEKTAVISEGMAYFALASEDTAPLESGDYLWDCVLRDFWGEGKPHTPQLSNVFRIMGVSHSV